MADYNAKGLQDKDNNNLNFTPTNFMDAQGNSKSIEVEFGKKQNTLSVEADSADIDDSTPIVKTLDGTKLKTALAVKFWNYIKGKISSVLGLTVTNYGGTANTATNYNTSSGTIKTALDAKVDIANASLESQSTTILAQVQTLASNNIHYKRFYTKSDGGSANISDKPTGTTNGGFMLEAYCNRYVSSSDWRYVVLCYVQVSKPKIAWIKTGDTSISWQDQDTNTDTKVKATAKTNDNVNYKILATASASPTSGAATEAVYDTDITLNPSTNTITANVSGNAATATTATNYNTSSGNIKTALEGKSSTAHTHSVSINGSTKTIAASGGTAVDLGTYKVFNYARMFPTQAYNANTNRYILLASKAATYTHNWEESSMFKLVVHAGQVPKELVFRLWVYGYVSSGTVPSDPSNPKLYRLCAENFSESELGILDVRLFVGEKSAGSITFTIGIFIDRNYLQGPHISYQLYPLSCETRDRGDVIDNGLSSWTYTVGHDIYSGQQHTLFTTAFEVSELPIRMNVVDAYELEYLTGPITSLNPLKLPSNIICPDGYAPQPGGSYIALSQFVQNKTHRFELWEPMSESVWVYNDLGVTIVYRTVNSMGYIEYDVLSQEVIILNRGGNRVKPTSAWATLIGTNLYVTFGY